MRCPDLDGDLCFFFLFDFSVDCRYHHFVVAFLAWLEFFEHVVTALEFSDILDAAFFPGLNVRPVHSLVSLALLLPGIAVSVRRLHDLDRSGWWMLIILTGIGLILLLVWFCLRGTPGPNRYGPDPLGVAPAVAGQQQRLRSASSPR